MLQNSQDFCGFVAGGAEGNRTPDLCSAIARHARISLVFLRHLRGTLGKPTANAEGTNGLDTAEIPHTKAGRISAGNTARPCQWKGISNG